MSADLQIPAWAAPDDVMEGLVEVWRERLRQAADDEHVRRLRG